MPLTDARSTATCRHGCSLVRRERRDRACRPDHTARATT